MSGFVGENFASRANYFLLRHFSLPRASFTLNRNNNASSLTWSRTPRKFRSFPFPKLGAFSPPPSGVGSERELLFIVIHSLMSKVDDEARCQFSVKRFPWQNTGENCDERSSNDELFFFSFSTSKLLCNSNGGERERERAILFELLGWKVYPLPSSSFFYEVSFVNNFVDFCFNEDRRFSRAK